MLAVLCEGLAESVAHHFLVEEDVQTLEGRVIGSEAAVVQRQSVHSLLRHIGLGQDCSELAGAVVAEVEENHRIALLDSCYRLAALGNHHRLDELVGHICRIGSLDSLLS